MQQWKSAKMATILQSVVNFGDMKKPLLSVPNWGILPEVCVALGYSSRAHMCCNYIAVVCCLQVQLGSLRMNSLWMV